MGEVVAGDRATSEGEGVYEAAEEADEGAPTTLRDRIAPRAVSRKRSETWKENHKDNGFEILSDKHHTPCPHPPDCPRSRPRPLRTARPSTLEAASLASRAMPCASAGSGRCSNCCLESPGCAFVSVGRDSCGGSWMGSASGNVLGLSDITWSSDCICCFGG